MIQSDEFFSQPLGLIAIDLWESAYNIEFDNKHHQWLENLSQQLSKIEFGCIINSANHTKIDYNDPSIYNTLVCYNWDQYDQDVMLELISQCNNYVMSKKILNTLGNNIFALYSLESFNKHCNKLVPHIKNWLVVGCHWQCCTHNRRLGLLSLCSQTDLNIFGATWGFLKEDNTTTTPTDFTNDKQLNWIHQFEDFYSVKLK